MYVSYKEVYQVLWEDKNGRLKSLWEEEGVSWNVS